MPFVPVPNTVAVNFVQTQFGSRMMNTMYFEGAAPWDTASLEAFAEEIRDAWEANVLVVQANTVDLVQVEVIDLSSQNAPGVIVPPEGASTGGLSSPGLPNGTTCAVSFRTLLRGRSYRGRIYWIGLTEASVTGDTVSEAFVTQMLTSIENVALAATINGAEHVVVSRETQGAQRPSGVTTPVTSYTCDGIIDSQRRRLTGRGQ